MNSSCGGDRAAGYISQSPVVGGAGGATLRRRYACRINLAEMSHRYGIGQPRRSKNADAENECGSPRSNAISPLPACSLVIVDAVALCGALKARLTTINHALRQEEVLTSGRQASNQLRERFSLYRHHAGRLLAARALRAEALLTKS